MTNPFQSIIALPDNSQGRRDELKSFTHAPDCVRTEQSAQPILLPKILPFTANPISVGDETINRMKPRETDGASGFAVASPPPRKPLQGGDYSAADALQLLNSHYMIGKSDQEVAIFRIKDDGSLAFTPPEQFKLDVANILVRRTSRSKPMAAEKFWKESPDRHERKIVFKPAGATEPGEFNLWRGFGVDPRKGWQKQRRLMQHIFKVICRKDRAKFRYLIGYLAYAVQHPDEQPGVAIMLKSRKEGTGKSTLGVVMLRIFGPHGALVDDKDRLLGRFNDWLEKTCFVLGEEILWAGDHKSSDKLKSMITANTIQIERKHGGILQIQNRLHLMLTSNHDHALGAGVGNRRYFVLDVSDEHACDKDWFDPLYRDLDQGGVSEFLYLLQNLNLGVWHPREMLKTDETVEQQRMSGDSVTQWSQACINADAIVGEPPGRYGLDQNKDLGAAVSVEELREAYTGFCRQNSLRPVGTQAFGKACAELFGPRVRLSSDPNANNRRPWAYHVPKGDQWQEKVDARLGIKS